MVLQVFGVFDLDSEASAWISQNPGDYIVVHGTAVHMESLVAKTK
jgi:hypothetical protein